MAQKVIILLIELTVYYLTVQSYGYTMRYFITSLLPNSDGVKIKRDNTGKNTWKMKLPYIHEKNYDVQILVDGNRH